MRRSLMFAVTLGVVISFVPARRAFTIFRRRIVRYRNVGIHAMSLEVVRAAISNRRLVGEASLHVDGVFGLSQRCLISLGSPGRK